MQVSTGQPRWFCNDKKAADCETAPVSLDKVGIKSGIIGRNQPPALSAGSPAVLCSQIFKKGFLVTDREMS
jgi:hypothetical protein